MSGATTPERLMAAGIQREAAVLLAPSMIAIGVTANALFGPFPARSYIDRLLLRNNGTQSVNVGIGTTLGATDVLNPAVPNTVNAGGTLTVDLAAFSEGSFPAIATQLLYLTFVGTAGYSIDATLIWHKGP
jgi:hypothetical protein